MGDIYIYIKRECSHDFIANQVELGLPPVKKPHSVTFEREIRNRVIHWRLAFKTIKE